MFDEMLLRKNAMETETDLDFSAEWKLCLGCGVSGAPSQASWKERDKVSSFLKLSALIIISR